GVMQLRSAVTPARAEDIARHARRVNPDQHGLIFLPCALYEGEVYFVRVGLFIRHQLEMSMRSGHVYFHLAADKRFFLDSVFNEVFDRHKFKIKSLRYFNKI